MPQFAPPLLRHDDPRRAIDLNQFEVEDQILACQLMIGIQHHGIWLHFHDDYRHLLTFAIVHSELHAYFGLDIRRKTIDGKFDYRLGISWSIGILHGDFNGFFLSYRHTKDAIIESFDHITATHLKLQRTTPFGGIKCRSVSEPSVIMDFYGITGFYFLCHEFLFKRFHIREIPAR
jgi:hypothetical protein